ncbi:hypothetical protein LX95_02908 [Mesonia algae]|uniref:Uncharacterized protein n=1 Tax=Mesonia algae TaxID=213248 RepID=A0A2W7HTP8_9FLAO|nr:hypothetical protein LX95_02908 [Mesonia algae]
MKLNKINLFLLIWVIHLFIYYAIYLSSNSVLFNKYDEIYKVILGFIPGFMGIFEQIPLFFFIPLILMLILIKTRLKIKWFKAYVISICSSYLLNYVWMFSNNKHDIIYGMPEQINLIYFIIPSLVVSIALNWLIFRKTFKKLGL